MNKNLFCAAAAESIIQRVCALQPGATAMWGSMNATEMLRHANLCNEEIFSGATPVRRTTIKQYLLRLLALYIAPRFAKGIKGDAAKDVKGKIPDCCFEEEKANFIQLIRRFPNHRQRVTLPHIAFGNLNTRQWGIAAYKHMDHHLRQFGV